MSTLTHYLHHHGSDRGPRTHQADAAGHHRVGGRIAWAVADGVGNHSDAPAAARRAVTTATRTAAATGDALLGVQAARDALAALHERGFGGDSTLVLAVATHDGVDLAWVGDSRAYLVVDGAVRQLTVDHNAGTWLRGQGVEVPDDSTLFNRLTSHVRNGDVGRAHVAAPIDRLLLCTDGVYRVLDDALLSEAARRFAHRPAALTHRLMLAVRNRGAVDNATVLVVQAATGVGMDDRDTEFAGAPDASEVGSKDVRGCSCGMAGYGEHGHDGGQPYDTDGPGRDDVDEDRVARPR